MKKNGTAAVLFGLVLALLFSGCSHQAGDLQGQQEDFGTNESVLENPEASSEEAEGRHPLISVVETVLAKLPEGTAEDDWNRGVILDFNEDGCDDLILTYCGVNDWEQRLEVWTTREETPLLLWEETLFERAGGPMGGVRMVTKGETPFLCIYSTAPGAKGLVSNWQFTGSLDFYSPTYQTEDGLYRQHWLSYDFFGPDNRTPVPDAPEAEPVLLFDGQHCTSEVFQEWMGVFDQSAPSILQVGGAMGEPVGMKFTEIKAILEEEP